MGSTSAWISKMEITELLTRYVALNDAGDWEALAAMYSEDGRMNRPTAPNDFVVGREAILASFKARPRRISRHIVVNILITLDDDTHATATSQLLLYTGKSHADGGLPEQAGPPLIGSYVDQLVRVADGWRFLERRGSLDFRP